MAARAVFASLRDRKVPAARRYTKNVWDSELVIASRGMEPLSAKYAPSVVAGTFPDVAGVAAASLFSKPWPSTGKPVAVAVPDAEELPAGASDSFVDARVAGVMAATFSLRFLFFSAEISETSTP